MKYLSSFPGTLCPLFGPQPFKTRPFSSKNKGHLISRCCVYISQDAFRWFIQDAFIGTVDSNWGFRYPFGGACPTTEVRECTPYSNEKEKTKQKSSALSQISSRDIIYLYRYTDTTVVLVGSSYCKPFPPRILCQHDSGRVYPPGIPYNCLLY